MYHTVNCRHRSIATEWNEIGLGCDVYFSNQRYSGHIFKGSGRPFRVQSTKSAIDINIEIDIFHHSILAHVSWCNVSSCLSYRDTVYGVFIFLAPKIIFSTKIVLKLNFLWQLYICWPIPLVWYPVFPLHINLPVSSFHYLIESVTYIGS